MHSGDVPSGRHRWTLGVRQTRGHRSKGVRGVVLAEKAGCGMSEEIQSAPLFVAGRQSAKLALPWQGYLLSRRRLNEAVNRLRFGGVVSIVAGPGWGKTALMVDLLKRNEGPFAYYSLDEEDRDPAVFLHGLVAALRLIDPRAATASLHLLESSPDLRRDCVGIAGLIAAELQRSMPRPEGTRPEGTRPMLALDELQVLPDDCSTTQCLRAFLEGAPVGWICLLASRRSLACMHKKLLSQGRRLQLGGRRLRLTPLEVRAWAEAAWGLRLELADARAVWRLTEGWPVALVLMGERLRNVGKLTDRSGVMALLRKGADLLQYLEHEVFQTLDRKASDVLMKAWPLDAVSFPRDDALLPSGSEDVLHELADRGFFVTKSGRGLFRLHPLIRAYAEREMSRNDARAAADLMRSTAHHLKGVGLRRDAVSLYLRVGEIEKATPLLRDLAIEAINASTPYLEAEWLDLLPEDLVAAEPWLLMIRARLLQDRGSYVSAQSLYRSAARLFQAANETTGQLQSLLGEALCLYVLGRWEECLTLLNRAERLTSSPLQRAEVLCNSATVLLALCRWDEAVERLEFALAQSRPDTRKPLEARIDVYRARLFYLRGLYVTGARWAERALVKAGAVGHELYATSLNASATLLTQLARYDEALIQVEASLAIVQARRWVFMEAPVTLCAAGVYFGLGRVRDGIEYAKKALELSRRVRDVEAEVWSEDLLGDACRRNRNVQKAQLHHERALDLCRVHGLSAFETARSMCGLGMDLAVGGDEESAGRHLAQASSMARKHGLTSILALARLYEGWLHARRGDERAARAALAEAMRLSEEGGYVHALTQEATVACPILALCERYGLPGILPREVLPRLTGRLQKRYRELSEGAVYPTDVALGFPPAASPVLPRPAPSSYADAYSTEDGAKISQLTDREMEILEMVGMGLPNKLIAAKLFIAEKTVKTHTNRMFRKLGVTNRLQAVLAFQAHQRHAATTRAARPEC